MNKLLTFWRNGTADPRIEELRKIGLFQNLSAAELRVMDELLHERAYETGEVVFDEGDLGLGLFIIVSGRVKAITRRSLPEQLSLEFCCGDFFGELSLFDEAPRTAKVIALEPSRVVALFRAELNALLERDRDIAAKVLFELARTVSRRSRQLLTGQQHLPSV